MRGFGSFNNDISAIFDSVKSVYLKLWKSVVHENCSSPAWRNDWESDGTVLESR